MVPGCPNNEVVLGNLKTLSISKTLYGRLANQSIAVCAASLQANSLPVEYNRKARILDRDFVEASEVLGPGEKRLAEYPLRGFVVGAFGEALEDIHTLVDYMASQRVKQERMLGL